MGNFRTIVNRNISERNKVVNYCNRLDIGLQYGVIKMMAVYWKVDIKTAYRMYADYIITGKTKKEVQKIS